jgi:sterol desaturase/sphingolipid hydroxylase (fatty acid hydroxylase superfamily)
MHSLRLWLVPLTVAAIVLEIIWYRLVQKRAYPWRELVATAGVYVLHVPGRMLLPVVAGPLALLVWSHRLMTIPLNTAWGLMLLFLAVELAYYWMHRAGHEVRWLWASHVVHHTPEHIHFASSFRLGATEVLSGNWLFYMPLYWIGFHPLAVSVVLGLNLFYQFWLHTDLVGRLGPLEWVLNTPSHHRVHHASDSAYLDRNYGGILIIWDRLFGTFADERLETPITYGLVHPIGTLNPIRITFHEWAAMLRDVAGACTWRGCLIGLFGRPGALAVGDSAR